MSNAGQNIGDRGAQVIRFLRYGDLDERLRAGRIPPMVRTPLLLVSLLIPVAGGTAAAQQAQPVTISRQDCTNIMRHSPSADVAYKPGVDVSGRAVAPADLPAQPSLVLPDQITINLLFNPFAGRTNVPGTGATSLMPSQGSVGAVTVDTRTGRVTYNGQPVGDSQQNAVAEACRNTYRR